MPQPVSSTELEEYNVEAVTPGDDAQGQVQLRVKREGDSLYRSRSGDGHRRGERAGVPRRNEQDRDQATLSTVLARRRPVSRWS